MALGGIPAHLEQQFVADREEASVKPVFGMSLWRHDGGTVHGQRVTSSHATRVGCKKYSYELLLLVSVNN